MKMQDRRADRPEGAPQDPYAKDVRALWPVVRPGMVNIYRGRKNGMMSDLVTTLPESETETLGQFQRAGYIVWAG